MTTTSTPSTEQIKADTDALRQSAAQASADGRRTWKAQGQPQAFTYMGGKPKPSASVLVTKVERRGNTLHLMAPDGTEVASHGVTAKFWAEALTDKEAKALEALEAGQVTLTPGPELEGQLAPADDPQAEVKPTWLAPPAATPGRATA